MTRQHRTPAARTAAGLPTAALAPIAVASLATMMTETLPAGLLPQLAAGLHTTPAVAGQAVSTYAAASMLAALPLLALTRTRPQRPVLVAAIGVVGAGSVLAALAPNVPALLATRVLAGAAAGLLWALAAHYAMAITPDGHKARALSIAMLGVPIGMAIGTPAGTFAGQAIGWRAMLTILGIGGLATALWAWMTLPALPGATPRAEGTPPGTSLLCPPLLALYTAAFLFEVGHMTSYTYASQLATRAGHLNPGTFLLAIGISAVIGLIATGRVLDAKPVQLFTLDLAALAAALLALWHWGTTPLGAIVTGSLWGLTLGPATTLAQACAARLETHKPDLAQGILVTVLNAGMATGAATGGAILNGRPTQNLPLSAAALLGFAALVSLAMQHNQTERGRWRRPHS